MLEVVTVMEQEEHRMRSKIQSRLRRSLATLHLGSKCKCCGSLEKLQIHHVDGSWKNNDVSNLELLCWDCHKKTLFGLNPYKKRNHHNGKFIICLGGTYQHFKNSN